MRYLIDSPRWLLLAILVYAPWALGCIPKGTLDILIAALWALATLWLIGCVVRRLVPKIPLVCLVAIFCLLIQGWGMIFNAEYFYDRTRLVFVRVPQFLSFAPGVLDKVYAIPMMLRITGLLGVVCFVCDLAARPQWRMRLWWTIGLTGVSLALWGLEQRIAGAVWWTVSLGRPSTTFFATYLYPGNASAFLNLVLPPILGLAALSLRNRGAAFQRAVWVVGGAICLAGTIATASKAGMAVTAILMAAFGIRELASIWKRRHEWLSSKSVLPGLIFAAVLVLAIGAIGWDAAMKRWENPNAVEESWQARWLTYQACRLMLPDSGLWGFGPGNFVISFPHYTGYFGGRIIRIWEFAHQDYLQTLIEWGWAGTAVWAVLFFGGIGVGFRNLWKAGNRLGTSDRMLLFTSLLALIGVALHAAVDFPLQIASLQLYAAVYTGLAWSSSSWLRRVADAPSAG